MEKKNTIDPAQKLTSIKLQTMINMDNLDMDLWCPILRFGRGNKSTRRFPIVFKNDKAASKLYDELEKLIGSTLKEVEEKSNSLYNKYKKYHYKS